MVFGMGTEFQTSLIGNLDSGMTEPIFKEGLLFQMNSRFIADMSVDLPSLASLLDFKPINFPNPSSLQLKGCEITRGGIYDPSDVNITPNISASDLASDWMDNNGINNTFVGGTINNTIEVETIIVTQGHSS